MEVRIKFSQEEIEALCTQKCHLIAPTPEGKRWVASLRPYSGATCELEDIKKRALVTPPERSDLDDMAIPEREEDEVAF